VANPLALTGIAAILALTNREEDNRLAAPRARISEELDN